MFRTIVLITVFMICIAMVVRTAYAEEANEVRGWYRVMVGDFEVIVLSDGVSKRLLAQQLQLLQGDKEKIREVLTAAYPDEQMDSTVNAYLINTGTKLMLIDAGYGSMGSQTMGNLINNLRVAGYQPEQINEIYLTHMHVDHVGGLISGVERVFPNATLYANKREAEYWLSDSNLDAAPSDAKRGFQAAKAAITPYIQAGKFETFTGNTSLAPGIRAEERLGHTPGHTAYFIESRGSTLVLWGDIIHVAAVQFENPFVTIFYDSNQVAAANTRQQILAEAAKNNWLIGGAHIAFPGLGHVRANGGDGYIFIPFNLSASK